MSDPSRGGSNVMMNVKIVGIVIGTLGIYTWVANSIPQIESQVPQELTFTGEVTTGELVAAGEDLFLGAGGCTVCHGLGERAPNLRTGDEGGSTVGLRCATRVQGEDCKTYLYNSMTDPNSYVVAGWDSIMPDMRVLLSETQIWALVAYLQDQGGEVTVTGADIEATGGSEDTGAAGPAPAGGAPAQAVAAAGGDDPLALLQNNLCLSCHILDGQGIQIGPSFDGIGARRDADYIRESILDPAADADPAFQAFVGLMPPTFGSMFTAAQLEAIVQYLAARQ